MAKCNQLTLVPFKGLTAKLCCVAVVMESVKVQSLQIRDAVNLTYAEFTT